MGKKKNSKLPFVSVCTPTFNRRPFIENIMSCFKNQTYPQSRMEWIIIDDGTDKVKDLFQESGIVNVRYFEHDKKMTLGRKRNLMHEHCKGDIIVYMDDDDYYPPERVEHAVETLTNNPNALCAGASEIYVFFKGMNKMIQCGPYGPNHATAGTFAFKKQLLEQTSYDDNASLAEERAFLKEYTIPFVQLDPMKTILVFSHEHNTFDKRKMFQQKQDPSVFKESVKVVKDFIRQKREKPIMSFFLQHIDGLLAKYDLGKAEMKPDVLEQIKQIEATREQRMKELQQQHLNNVSPITLLKDGKETQLTHLQVVTLIQNLQSNIANLQSNIANLTNTNHMKDKYTELLKEKVGELIGTVKEITAENSEMKKQITLLTQNVELQQVNTEPHVTEATLGTKESTQNSNISFTTPYIDNESHISKLIPSPVN